MGKHAHARAGEQRAAERFDTAMPVQIDGAPGVTQNVSATGVYFETDLHQQLGSLVRFTVEFSLHGERHRMQCEGEVVRVDERGERVGVAARLAEPFFEEDA